MRVTTTAEGIATATFPDGSELPLGSVAFPFAKEVISPTLAGGTEHEAIESPAELLLALGTAHKIMARRHARRAAAYRRLEDRARTDVARDYLGQLAQCEFVLVDRRARKVVV
jgi:hypothetical protein